ncbi:prohibitin family protein [Archaeoglobus veneficus]|uniref:Band 7 protein n=1 Tax=Archaeoglobus veneficus (strain DSM 11195 / SNP6) TaxID=693661 RepID=F2KP99_ARCVS|nr:prohibitin family protein [Archaeoglobus veneficus]AEA47503.1 band 7 protein [Archaeoglobus veneficus SNP6]
MEDYGSYSISIGERKRKIGKVWATVALILFVLAVVAASSIVVIDSTEVGVVKILGKVQDEELTEGVHIVTPFITEVIRMPIYEKTMELVGEKHIKALTTEGLPVYFDMAIQYKIEPTKASDVYKSLKNYEIWMENRIRAKARDIIAQYKADDLYTEHRTAVQAEFEKEIASEFEPYGIIVTAVLIRNIDLPESVENAIQAKIQAKQEAERMQFVVQKEKLEAERKKIEAEGIAEANKIIGQSLERNPLYLQWYYLKTLQELEGKEGDKIIIMPVPSSMIPGVNISEPVTTMILPTK